MPGRGTSSRALVSTYVSCEFDKRKGRYLYFARCVKHRSLVFTDVLLPECICTYMAPMDVARVDVYLCARLYDLIDVLGN